MGAILTDCFSTGKDELLFHFTKSNVPLQLSVRFAGGEMFFRSDEMLKMPGRNGLQQFKTAIQQNVESVSPILFDRAFVFQFSGGTRIVFKGFGKFGNVLEYAHSEMTPSTIFRLNLKKDQNQEFPEQKQHFQQHGNTIEAVMKANPFLAIEHDTYLSVRNFNEATPENQRLLLNALISDSESAQFYIDSQKDIPDLYCLPYLESKALSPGLEGLNAFAKAYLNAFYFTKEREKQLQENSQQTKHFLHLLKENNKKLDLLQNKRSYKELGDIVMGFVHSIKPGVSNALLTDYYTGNPIRIKLDPTLSAAENASHFYRKAKNEHLEMDKVVSQIAASEAALIRLEKDKDRIITANNFSDLKPAKNNNATREENTSKPYKQLIFEGFEIWVGKNAKSNDQMLKLSAKNDLWLHARDVQGSHIIVKKKGGVFPTDVIQFAANLAAKNSKGKTQGVVSVIAVERKFVVKGKNAKPGEVKLLKEEIVDAFPDEV